MNFHHSNSLVGKPSCGTVHIELLLMVCVLHFTMCITLEEWGGIFTGIEW